MKLRSKEDITRYIAQKTKQDPDLINYVIRNLWDTVRRWLTNPTTAAGNILLNTFCKFEITDYALETKLNKNLSPHIRRLLEKIKDIRDGKKKK